MKNGNRIAFAIGSMTRGGAERVISILAEHYISKGWNVDILMLLSDTVKYEINPEIRLLPLCADASVPRIFRVSGWLSGIRRYCKKERPAVVVSFAARINVIVLLATFGLPIRIVVSERNDPMHDTRGLLGGLLAKALYPRADAVIFQSRRVRSYFGAGIQAKSFILPNPVSVEADASETPLKKIVNIGRLYPQKNQEMLIRAFYQLHEKYSDYTLHIFGEGILQGRLEALIRSLHLEGSVFLRGNLPHIHKEISDAAMFVLSSDYEGLSNALLEAMMMGLPCISTDCAGSDEVISDGVNGLLVPVGNADSLAGAMESLISDRALAKTIGENARESAEKFKKAAVAEMWEQIVYETKTNRR